MKQILAFGEQEVVELTSASPDIIPGRMHIGDIDADGYPDLLITGKVSEGKT